MTNDHTYGNPTDDLPLSKRLRWLLIALSIAVLGNAGMLLYWIWRMPSERLSVATVDLEKIVREEQERYAKVFTKQGPQNTEEWARLNAMTQDFSSKLSDRLSDISAGCDCVLINRAAVISANAPDLTDLVRKGLPR
jgi:hypothetical protein